MSINALVFLGSLLETLLLLTHVFTKLNRFLRLPHSGSGACIPNWPHSSGCRDALRQAPSSSSPAPEPPAPRPLSIDLGSSTSVPDWTCSSGCWDALRPVPSSSSPSPE